MTTIVRSARLRRKFLKKTKRGKRYVTVGGVLDKKERLFVHWRLWRKSFKVRAISVDIWLVVLR